MNKTSSAKKIATKDESLLVSVARSIGSTLGSVAAIATPPPKKVRRRRSAVTAKRSRPKSRKGAGRKTGA
jgi:hypothetical protein